jgi:hypothetical protein
MKNIRIAKVVQIISYKAMKISSYFLLAEKPLKMLAQSAKKLVLILLYRNHLTKLLNLTPNDLPCQNNRRLRTLNYGTA